MGVASGMPCDADLLQLLPQWMAPVACGRPRSLAAGNLARAQKTAEVGGMLRTGLEDTFYLPNGDHARGCGDLITELAACTPVPDVRWPRPLRRVHCWD